MKIATSPITSLSKASALAVLMAVASLTPAEAVTRTWTGSGADADFRTFGNWGPSGGANGNDLIFETANLSVILESGDSSPKSVHITSAANNFRISSSSGKRLVIGERITVDAGVSAVFDVGLGVTSSTTAAFSYTIDVGSGGSLVVNGAMSGYSLGGSMYKTGTGSLYIGESTGGMQAGFTSHYQEGTVTLRSGITVGAPTAGAPGLMAVNLGTSSTSATLNVDRVNSTRARIYGSLVTSGLTNSRIETASELHIGSINETGGIFDATAGVTLAFNLGDGGFITGRVLNLSETILFDLTGGAMGETYNLLNFSEVNGFDASKFTFRHDQYSNFNVQLNNGIISVQVIPEPQVAMLLGVALIGGLVHWVRR